MCPRLWGRAGVWGKGGVVPPERATGQNCWWIWMWNPWNWRFLPSSNAGRKFAVAFCCQLQKRWSLLPLTVNSEGEAGKGEAVNFGEAVISGEAFSPWESISFSKIYGSSMMWLINSFSLPKAQEKVLLLSGIVLDILSKWPHVGSVSRARAMRRSGSVKKQCSWTVSTQSHT